MLISGTPAGAHASTQTITLPVTGALKPIDDIRFSTTSQIIQVTRYCVLVTCNTTDAGAVEFYGTGVPDLVRRMRAAGQTSIPAVLQTTAAHTLTVTLSAIKQMPSDPTRATAS
ncbi:MAG: hypothetical protein WBP81_34695 [Solirubrobacteraceae bacterium]